MSDTIIAKDDASMQVVAERSSSDSNTAVVTVRSTKTNVAEAIDDLRSDSAAAVASKWAMQKIGRCGYSERPWPIALDAQYNRIPEEKLMLAEVAAVHYEVEFTFKSIRS